MQGSENQTLEETRCWIKNFVIAHALCPFAQKPFQENRIRYVVAQTSDEKELVDVVVEELYYLEKVDISTFETSLLIVPNCLLEFEKYNQYISVVDAVLEQMKLEGIIQIATFHPSYRFEDLTNDDVRNYTNRSPYPMFHLIREQSVEKVREIYPQIHEIPQKNMESLLNLGEEAINSILDSCHAKKQILK